MFLRSFGDLGGFVKPAPSSEPERTIDDMRKRNR